MQRKLPEQLAADIQEEIKRIKSLKYVQDDELSYLEIYYAEVFAVENLITLLEKMKANNKIDVNDFIEYLRNCEAVINGVYADRQRRLAAKSGLKPVFRHQEESNKKRITDIDYPSSPKTCMALVNTMLASKLYQYFVINAPDDEKPEYATPLDFLYSNMPSHYPHAEELALPFAAFVLTQDGRPINIVASLDAHRDALLPEEDAALIRQSSEEARHYLEGISLVVEGETPAVRNERLKSLRLALLNKIYSSPLGLNLNGFIMTECGRPLNVMVTLEEFSKQSESALLPKHTAYTEDEFENGMPPRLLHSEHYMLMNHSEAARLYYEGIIKLVPNESVEARNERLGQLKMRLYKTIHDPNMKPGYHVEMNSENLDLERHLTNKFSAKRLLQNGFMADLGIASVFALAKLLSMVQLPNLPCLMDCIDYETLCEILLPKVKSGDGKLSPDVALLDDKTRLKKYLDKGEFWDAKAQEKNHDRIIQVCFAKLLEHKEVRENKKHKQSTLTEYIKFLCEYNPETKQPKYCMNQFPEYMRANHNDKTFTAPSNDGRVSVLLESGKNRHDVKIRVNERYVNDALSDENLQAPEGYGQKDLLRDIKFIASKPRSEWREMLTQLFTEDRINKLNAYLNNKERNDAVVATRFTLFNSAVNWAVNGDAFLGEYDNPEYYMDFNDNVEYVIARDNNDAAHLFFARWYWHIRSKEGEKYRQAMLDSEQQFEEMLISNHPTNNIFEYLREVGREDLSPNFKPGEVKARRLPTMALEAKKDRELEAKARNPQVAVPENVVAATNANSSWFSRIW